MGDATYYYSLSDRALMISYIIYTRSIPVLQFITRAIASGGVSVQHKKLKKARFLAFFTAQMRA